jgi:rSAM/selenodomain-associated transferase 1
LTSRDHDQPSVLAIMARAPVLHQCKTRLESELGAEGALQAHIELVHATLARLHKVTNVQVSLWVTQFDEATRAWGAEFDLPVYEQHGSDLGARMHNVFVSLFEAGAGQVCLVGTDCPEVSSSYVVQAFAGLSVTPLVLGPAQDGGYGLIGMSKPCAVVFQDIEWSSPVVSAQTLQRAAAANLAVTVLETIWDVDDPADWRRYLRWKERQAS